MTAQDPCVVQFGILTERTTENNHELNHTIHKIRWTSFRASGAPDLSSKPHPFQNDMLSLWSRRYTTANVRQSLLDCKNSEFVR